MQIFQVDAFTGKPFAGNPAAVCLVEADLETSYMQDLAREMNLSETAFVRKVDDGYDLRWFTPGVEVDLCGHATLATAHVLWEEKLVGPDEPIAFNTRSGVLTCRQRSDRIEMDFPARPTREVDPPREIVDALGVRPVASALSEVGYVFELASEQDVCDARPDFTRLRNIRDSWSCITAAGESAGFDFVSRFFAPESGIDEDPVTGAAHCALAYYWSQRSGRHDFRAYQCSARGGVVFARLEGDRVILGGQAVTVLRGELASG